MPDSFDVHPDKLSKYLLNLRHPQGGTKARFFVGHGFSPDRPAELSRALVAHTIQLCRQIVVEDGLKLIFTGPLATPNGTSPVVRTVWKQEGGSTSARFLTAYPA